MNLCITRRYVAASHHWNQGHCVMKNEVSINLVFFLSNQEKEMLQSVVDRDLQCFNPKRYLMASQDVASQSISNSGSLDLPNDRLQPDNRQGGYHYPVGQYRNPSPCSVEHSRSFGSKHLEPLMVRFKILRILAASRNFPANTTLPRMVGEQSMHESGRRHAFMQNLSSLSVTPW